MLERVRDWAVILIGAAAIIWFANLAYRGIMDAFVGPPATLQISSAPEPTPNEKPLAFQLVDDGSASGVAIYRDTSTGCDWIRPRGAGTLVERTAPDANGISRHMCQQTPE